MFWSTTISAAESIYAAQVLERHLTPVTGISNYRAGAAPTKTSNACPCCGSRQYMMHHGVKKCSYCRSEV